MSTDVTLLTIGGEEKALCRAGEVLVPAPDGTARPYGRFSWTLARALLNTPPGSSWIAVMAEMERIVAAQGWQQPLLFHGQPTRPFGLLQRPADSGRQ